MGRATARAVVHLTVEIEVSGWGAECTVQQVHDQAAREAEEMLRSVVASSPLDGPKRSMRIVGNPKVSAVIAERGS